MFQGDSADMCAGKFSLMSMGGRANGQAYADGERGPHRRARKLYLLSLYSMYNTLYYYDGQYHEHNMGRNYNKSPHVLEAFLLLWVPYICCF